MRPSGSILDSYGGGPDMLPALAELPLTDRWVGEDAGRIVGLMRELRVAQSFGGRFVPVVLGRRGRCRPDRSQPRCEPRTDVRLAARPP